ncbi:Hypothetical protein Cul05146_2042 [Corynebacterium ulcerans]|nr:Hypothetical protein Cul05146_2042 [Corynebacterium ulcerans]
MFRICLLGGKAVEPEPSLSVDAESKLNKAWKNALVQVNPLSKNLLSD